MRKFGDELRNGFAVQIMVIYDNIQKMDASSDEKYESKELMFGFVPNNNSHE